MSKHFGSWSVAVCRRWPAGKWAELAVAGTITSGLLPSLNGVQGVASSNLAVPTSLNLTKQSGWRDTLAGLRQAGARDATRTPPSRASFWRFWPAPEPGAPQKNLRESPFRNGSYCMVPSRFVSWTARGTLSGTGMLLWLVSSTEPVGAVEIPFGAHPPRGDMVAS